MKKQLEILITEDNKKHLADAKSISGQYKNINFTFASTLEEVEQLIEQNNYDAVVTDVFFPVQKGKIPTSDAGLNLGKQVDEKGIPFVYNTSGNHHGSAYFSFLRESRKIWKNYGFGTGKMIEAYPEYAEDEKDTKQWNAAINYAILLGTAHELKESVKEKIGGFLDFAPYGDYGKLTEKMQTTLDESISLEEIFRKPNTLPPYPWSSDALSEGWKQEKVGGKWGEGKDWDREKDCFVSLRATKKEDEKWFNEAEKKFKKEYETVRNFIRNTISNYKNDEESK